VVRNLFVGRTLQGDDSDNIQSKTWRFQMQKGLAEIRVWLAGMIVWHLQAGQATFLTTGLGCQAI